MRRNNARTQHSAESYRPNRAPPLAVSLAIAAVPPLAVFALTHPLSALAAVAAVTVLLAVRGDPR
jgi:ABC-type proline/glycine betaine transport system permease subunit